MIAWTDSKQKDTLIEVRVREDSDTRSEEHTSELQSLRHLVCRLLLEEKKINIKTNAGKYRVPSASSYNKTQNY